MTISHGLDTHLHAYGNERGIFCSVTWILWLNTPFFLCVIHPWIIWLSATLPVCQGALYIQSVFSQGNSGKVLSRSFTSAILYHDVSFYYVTPLVLHVLAAHPGFVKRGGGGGGGQSERSVVDLGFAAMPRQPWKKSLHEFHKCSMMLETSNRKIIFTLRRETASYYMNNLASDSGLFGNDSRGRQKGWNINVVGFGISLR